MFEDCIDMKIVLLLRVVLDDNAKRDSTGLEHDICRCSKAGKDIQ